MQDDLGVLGVVLVPGIVEGIASSGYGYRGNQAKRKALGSKEMGQRTVIVAGGFESDAARIAAVGK